MKLVTRIPNIKDAIEVYRLIDRCKPLDLNSEYYYMIMCSHFRGTSVVAEAEGEIVGFISAYQKPEDLRTLFVWQVAVDSRFRGKKVSKLMMANILTRANVKIVDKIETTVSPSNMASLGLFKSMAKTLKADMSDSKFISSDMFDGEHEEEVLYTIKPVDLTNYKGEIS